MICGLEGIAAVTRLAAAGESIHENERVFAFHHINPLSELMRIAAELPKHPGLKF